MSEVEISVWDERTGAVLLAPTRFSLPVRLGRKPDGAGGRIAGAGGREAAFGRDLSALSRDHLRLDGARGGVELRDRSRNGTEALGMDGARARMERDAPVLMRPGDVRAFAAVGVVIEVTVPAAGAGRGTGARLVYSSSSGDNKSVDLSRGALALLARKGRTEMVRLDATDPAGAAEEAALRDAARCVVGEGEDGPVAIALAAGAIRCNRAPLAPGVPRRLGHLDTLNVDGMRMRVLARDVEDVLVCANADCRQLNEHQPSHNCRFCGTRLGDARTFHAPKGLWV